MASPFVAHRFLACLSQAADGVRARLLDVYVHFDLNATCFQVLTTVGRHGDAGCSQTEIAGELRLAESSICALVDRLQAEGLLHRFRSRQDRRRSLILLTASGRQRLDAATAASEEALLRWLSRTSDDELAALCSWLETLSATVRCEERAEAIPAPEAGERSPIQSPSHFREAG